MKAYKLYSSVQKKWTGWLHPDGSSVHHPERKDTWEFLMIHTPEEVYAGWVRGGSLAINDKRELSVFGVPCRNASDNDKPRWFTARDVSVVNTTDKNYGIPKPT